MDFKLKYGPNFYVDNNINLFTITNEVSRGKFTLQADFSEAPEGQHSHKIDSKQIQTILKKI